MDRNTGITTDQIKDETLLPTDLNAINSPTANYYLRRASGQNKFEWVVGAGGVSNLPDLADVLFDTGTPADNDVLTYDTASGKWKAEASAGGYVDKIEEGDSKVEVVDTGTGYITFVADGTEEARIDANGFKLKSGADINEFSIDGTLIGDSDDAIPTEKAVKTYVDGLTGIDDFTIKRSSGNLKIADRIEENIMLNAFRIAINGSLSQQDMVDGIVDEYEDETGIDTASSTNEDYDATNDLYSPISLAGGIDTNTKLIIHANDGDSSGQAHNITYYGTAKIDATTKKFDYGSLYLDGNSDYLTIPDSVDWNFGTGDFTIDLWVRFTSVTGYQPFYSQQVNGSNFVQCRINRNTTSDGALLIYGYSGGNPIGFFYTSSSAGLVANTWYHLAFVRNGASCYIFVNGISQTLTQTTAWGTLPDLNAVVRIGYNLTAYLGGYIDGYRITKGEALWTSNFTPPTSAPTAGANTKLLLNFEEGDQYGGHNVEPQGGARVDRTTKKWGDGAWYFDGTDDSLELPDSADWDIVASNSDNWTIDFWVKHTDHAGYEKYMNQTDGANSMHFQHGHGFGLRFYVWSGGYFIDTGDGGEITDTNWHHIALCKVASKYACYLDGTQVNYTDDSSIINLTGSLYIGSEQGSSSYFEGYMDEIRIQHSNYFSASPNVGESDTITIPTAEYSTSSGTDNMTLISESNTASAQPDNARIVLFEEDVDSVTINTDLKAYVSRDGGTTWTQITLSDEGDYETGKQILSGSVDISGQPAGTSMEYKIITLNAKDLKIHGTGLLWD